jgi:putative flippase GtrA
MSTDASNPLTQFISFARSHARQFTRYLFSGGSAAVLELGSYQLMLMADIWYVAASAISGAIGLLSAFTFHKYFVFQKQEKTTEHVVRFAMLQTFNFFAQLLVVYILVEFMGVDEFFAKVLGIGATVSWNFFLYKLFVYV